MKKIFSLFAAILFAGSIFATDEVVYTLTPASGSNNSYTGNCDIEIDGIKWNLTGNSTVQPWRIGGKSLNGVDRNLYSKTAIEDNVSKIEVEHGTANNITVNSFTVTVASDAAFANVISTVVGTFEASNTAVIERPSGKDWSNAYFKFTYNVTVSGTSNKYLEFKNAKFYGAAADPSKPSLKADAIDFGLVKITSEESAYELDTTLIVTAANLTDPIAVTNGLHVTATESELPAEGGTIHLHISAPAGDFADEVKLSSGELNVKVAISGKVKQTIILPGQPAKMSAGTAAQDAKVNGSDAIKAGTGSGAGIAKITVPAATFKLHFFAAAWKGEEGELSLSAEGVTISPAVVTLLADEGISGSGTNYELKTLSDADCVFHVDLKDVTEETIIELTRGGASQRFVIWGATYETSGGGTALDNTNADAKVEKFFRNGQLIIRKNGVEYNALGTQL